MYYLVVGYLEIHPYAMIEQQPLLPKNKTRQNKDTFTRILRYLEWLHETKRLWYLFSTKYVEAYRLYLINKCNLKPKTVSNYISAVKRQYRRLLQGNQLKDLIQPLLAEGQSLDEILNAIEEAVDIHVGQMEFDRSAKVKHMTQEQIEVLLLDTDLSRLSGIRNLLILSTILCTGMTEREVCALSVSDIKYEDGHVEIHVPLVSGGKERTIRVYETLFFDEPWFAKGIKVWLNKTRIRKGPLYRGFYKSGDVREKSLHPNAIRKMMRQYTEFSNREKFTILDLRRTYARRLFDNGIELAIIQKNLGYDSTQTVVNYIGLPDRAERLGSSERSPSQYILSYLNS